MTRARGGSEHACGAIRDDGFAWTDQELDLDVNGVAHPIRSPTGELVAVATLYGPAYRLSVERSPDLGHALATFVSERGPRPARQLTRQERGPSLSSAVRPGRGSS